MLVAKTPRGLVQISSGPPSGYVTFKQLRDFLGCFSDALHRFAARAGVSIRVAHRGTRCNTYCYLSRSDVKAIMRVYFASKGRMVSSKYRKQLARERVAARSR